MDEFVYFEVSKKHAVGLVDQVRAEFFQDNAHEEHRASFLIVILVIFFNLI
jgi:hypothetical protein